MAAYHLFIHYPRSTLVYIIDSKTVTIYKPDID